mgnify:CR=1 FL=1
MSLIFKSIKNKNLKKKFLEDIVKLKSQEWKYSYISQKRWIKKNLHNEDIHNLFLNNEKLIGYTLLRKRQFYLIFKKKKLIKNYFYFDTLIINKKYRGKNFKNKKYSEIMMNFNNKVIRNNDYLSILHCYKHMIKFYKKFGWVTSGNKKIYCSEKKRLNIMLFNLKNVAFSEILFNIRK